MRPFWKRVLEYMETWLGGTLPLSPRLCLLGDRAEVREMSIYDYAVLKVGLVTASRLILQNWKGTGVPGIEKWREKMGEVKGYEKMLIRLGGGNHKFMRAWEGFEC